MAGRNIPKGKCFSEKSGLEDETSINGCEFRALVSDLHMKKCRNIPKDLENC